MTAQTPIYGLKYLVQGEPARNTRLALEENAFTIEAALQAGGVAAPGAADLLTVAGRVTALEDPPRARLIPGAAGSGGNAGGGAGDGNRFPVTTYVPIRWGAAPILDQWGWSASVPTRLVCQKPGDYLVTGSAAFTQGTGGRLAVLLKNGGQVEGSAATMTPYAGFYAMVPIPATLITLAVNDYLELAGYQDSAPTLTAPPAGAGGQSASFQAIRVAA